jgi:hypothetical protein
MSTDAHLVLMTPTLHNVRKISNILESSKHAALTKEEATDNLKSDLCSLNISI